MKWALAALLCCGCSSKKADDRPPPVKPVPADAARVAVAADAAVDAGRGAMTPVDARSLPAWSVPAGDAKGPPVELFAVDMDGDFLLAAIDPGETLIAPPSGRKLTGRVSAPRNAVYATLVAQLGIPAASPTLTGRGANVDLSFAAAPVADLVRLLADVGHVNIVAPPPLPALDIIVKRKPWDGVLTAVLEKSGRTVKRSGNTFYALPQGVALPDLPKTASVIVDLDVKDATIGQAIAALRELTDVPVGACDSVPFTLRLHRISLAEALRALQVASGAVLVAGNTCKTSKLDAPPAADLKLRAIARVDTKRAAVLARGGEIVTAVVDGKVVTDIGSGFVAFGSATQQLYDDSSPPVMAKDAAALIARVRRVAAIVHEGDSWMAYCETTDGKYQLVDPMHMYEWLDNPPQIDAQGIHLTIGPTKTVDLLLGR